MKISGLKQRKIALPRPKLSLRLQKPRLSRWHIVLLCLCAALTAAFCVLCIVYSNVADRLLTQQAAERYQGEGEQRYAQATAFFPLGAEKSIADIYTFRSTIDQKLLDVSLEEQDGAPPLWIDAYSGAGRLTVTGNKGRAEVAACGVGGDWFSFHPLTLRSGSYISEDSLMHDQVLLDERLAWQIFGSYDLAGMTVTIGGKPFVVSGVVAIEDDKASQKSYSETGEIFLHFDALLELTGEEGGIDCYELVCAEPISGFTWGLLSEGFKDALTVKNTGRFSLKNTLSVMSDYGTRSMQTAGLALPYWENAARLTEDTLAALLVAMVLCALLPAVCAAWLLVRLLRRGWRKLRWDIGPACFGRISDRLRESQRLALKRRQKRIEERWIKEGEEDEKPRK